jgi:hypothetical protein
MSVIGKYHTSIINGMREYDELRTVIKDGSVFMNKIAARPEQCIVASANRQLMIDTTREFYAMAINLSSRSIKYVNFHWCFYRAASYGASVGRKIPSPVPFSVTTYFNITPDWLKSGSNCCLYKIIVPGNTPFAILEPFYTPALRSEMTADQWRLYEGEAALLPGVMTVVKEEALQFLDKETRQNKNVRYLTCEYKPYSLSTAVDVIRRMKTC